MKGIILAGGAGTRLAPLTIAVSKQLLPVYNKPMIYYPLSTLMASGIRDILIITTPDSQHLFRQLLGDGSHVGCSFSYAIQDRPRGLADAFRVGKAFIGDDSVALILGDNIFFGYGLGRMLRTLHNPRGGVIFAYRVRNPEDYGVVVFDREGHVTDIREKPRPAPSPYAVPGLYFYDNTVVDIAAELQPSARGELEITDVNRAYLQQGKLSVRVLGAGVAWLDTGTFDALLKAAHFVEVLESRQGIFVGSIEEVAYRMGYIDAAGLEKAARRYGKSAYGQMLLNLRQNPPLSHPPTDFLPAP